MKPSALPTSVPPPRPALHSVASTSASAAALTAVVDGPHIGPPTAGPHAAVPSWPGSALGEPPVITRPLDADAQAPGLELRPLASSPVGAATSGEPSVNADPVEEMLARLNTTIDIARASPQRHAAVAFLRQALSSTDLVRSLTTRDDDLIRGDRHVRVALGGARDLLDHLRRGIEQQHAHLPPTVARGLKARWRDADRRLRNFSLDASLTSRIASLTAIRAVNTFLFLGVPLAETQRKTTALYVATASKSALRAGGLSLRATTHGPQVLDHFVGRDLINSQQSLLFAVHLIGGLMAPGASRDRLEAITTSTPYLALIGVASVISAMLAFHHQDLSRLLNKLFHGHTEPDLQGRETLGAQAVRHLADLRDRLMGDARRSLTQPTTSGVTHPRDLPADVREALAQLMQVAGDASVGTRHLGHEMRRLGQLSDSSGKVFGSVEGAFDRLHQSLGVVLDAPAAQRANEQWLSKSVLAVFSLAACAAPAVFLKDNTIGFVDLVADAAFVFLVMAMNAADPHTRLEVSEDDFGQYCGFSLAMLPVWAYNRSMQDPMESQWTSAMHGAAVLAALGNTLASPTGMAVGWLAGKVHRGLTGQVAAVAPDAAVPPAS